MRSTILNIWKFAAAAVPVVICLSVTAGCGGGAENQAASGGNAPASATTNAPAATASTEPGTDARLQELEDKLKAAPDDVAIKTELAQATYLVGHEMMVNPDLPPRQKYPGALRHFRRTLELNPGHEKAAQEKKQIEDIYQSMGRPIPQ